MTKQSTAKHHAHSLGDDKVKMATTEELTQIHTFSEYIISLSMHMLTTNFCTFQSWFSNKAYHAMPAYLNTLSNTVLRSYVREDMGNPAAYGKSSFLEFD